MLALDFDGVVCDALTECAAVTWHAAHPPLDGETPPPLADAVEQVPEDFVRTFTSVRAYSKTLDDFMVANAVPVGHEVDQAGFAQHRAAAGSARLAGQAKAGEEIRGYWRAHQFDEWIALHTVYPEVADVIARNGQRVVIVSAKDADSIRAILAHHRLAGYVEDVFGSCADKSAAVAQFAAGVDASDSDVVFVDDNLANAVTVERLPGVRAVWATWGYHGPEDVDLAAYLGFPTLTLNHVDQLTRIPARPGTPH